MNDFYNYIKNSKILLPEAIKLINSTNPSSLTITINLVQDFHMSIATLVNLFIDGHIKLNGEYFEILNKDSDNELYNLILEDLSTNIAMTARDIIDRYSDINYPKNQDKKFSIDEICNKSMVEKRIFEIKEGKYLFSIPYTKTHPTTEGLAVSKSLVDSISLININNIYSPFEYALAYFFSSKFAKGMEFMKKDEKEGKIFAESMEKIIFSDRYNEAFSEIRQLYELGLKVFYRK